MLPAGNLKPFHRPLGAAEIARNCELLRLPVPAFVVGMEDGRSVELMRAVRPNLVTSTRAVTPYGPGIQHNDAATTGDEWQDRPFIKTSDGAGTGNFTVMAVINPESRSVKDLLVSQRTSATGLPQFYLMSNAYTAGSIIQAGTLSFGTYNMASTEVAKTSWADGGWHAFFGVRTGTTLALYRDGSADTASASGTVRNVLASTQHFSLGGSGDAADATGTANCARAFTAGWDVALTTKQIDIAAKHWPAILARPAHWGRVFVDMGAAASSILPFLRRHYGG